MVSGFKDLGISVEDVIALPVDQLFTKVIQGAESSATGLRGLQAVMGKGAITGRMQAVFREISKTGMPERADLDAAMRFQMALGTQAQEMKKTVQEKAMLTQYRVARAAGTPAAARAEEEAKSARAEETRRQQERLRLLREEAAARKEAAKGKIIAEAMAGLGEVKEKAAKQLAAITVAAPEAADRLARIGGIVGRQASPDRGVLERVAKAAEINNDLAKESNKIAAQMDEKLKALEES
jgi:hypothetical protein